VRNLLKYLDFKDRCLYWSVIFIVTVLALMTLSLGCSDDNHFTTEVTSDRPPCTNHDAIPNCDDGTIVTPDCQDHCPGKECTGKCEMEVCDGAEWLCPCTGRNCFEVTPAPKGEPDA